jgi:hypothetical protein
VGDLEIGGGGVRADDLETSTLALRREEDLETSTLRVVLALLLPWAGGCFSRPRFLRPSISTMIDVGLWVPLFLFLRACIVCCGCMHLASCWFVFLNLKVHTFVLYHIAKLL